MSALTKENEKSSEVMIRFEDLGKSFKVHGRTVEALKNVSLEIKKGEIFGIIGFSGA